MMTDTNSEDSYTDEESPKKRRDLLVRRPSYRKILNDLGGGEIGTLVVQIIFIIIYQFFVYINNNFIVHSFITHQ